AKALHLFGRDLFAFEKVSHETADRTLKDPREHVLGGGSGDFRLCDESAKHKRSLTLLMLDRALVLKLAQQGLHGAMSDGSGLAQDVGDPTRRSLAFVPQDAHDAQLNT